MCTRGLVRPLQLSLHERDCFDRDGFLRGGRAAEVEDVAVEDVQPVKQVRLAHASALSPCATSRLQGSAVGIFHVVPIGDVVEFCAVGYSNTYKRR